MDRSFLQFDYSGWWILLIVVVSALLSYLLYAKKNVPWSRTQNWILAAIRFLAIMSLMLLLLTPSLRQVTNTIEKPVLAIAIDNSQSIVARGETKNNLNTAFDQLEKDLANQGLEPMIIKLTDSDSFNTAITNLSSLMYKVEEATVEKNLAGVILATDAIFNRGSSPLYKNYLTPVFTIGLGDTIPPKDISISRTLYNKISYKENETPIRLEISQQGNYNKEVTVQLIEKGQILREKKVRLRGDIQEVEFIIKSESEGLRHITAHISESEGESTTENNRSNIFMEVIDSRQQILIVANSPHPDIKAIRSTLSETGNYQVDLYIPEIHDEKPNEIYDVVIFHGAFTSGISYTPKENPGTWYILSNESSITSLNRKLSFINIERRGSQPDKVAGSFNQNFSKFKIENVSAFEEYPPIQVPFGNYEISGPTEVLMYQKLGSITTQKPLMVIYDDGSAKSAVLAGQNIWQWKLQEAAIHDNAEQFNSLITKTVQFLSVKNDKKQFRFPVRKRNLTDTEPALFDAEVYNDIYERIYNNTIEIIITSESDNPKSFNFTDSEYNNTFRAPALPPGIYQYKAETKVGDKVLTDQGEFSIQNINPEYLTLTADHQLLKNIASKTGGEFVPFDEIAQLPQLINDRNFKSKIKSDEELIPLYKAWWWYFIIFSLFSTEWFFRKFWGGY